MQKNPQKNRNKKSEEGFISRWSRRKTDVANKSADNHNTINESLFTDEVLTDSAPEQTAEIKAPLKPEKKLTDEDMPPIDSLTNDSDFSMFMSPDVSDRLRNLALRKLFSGASFNIRDGLDDYDDDFRTFAALGDLVTCDMKHQMEMADERERKQEEAEAAEAVTQSDLEETEEHIADEADSDDRTDNQEGDAEVVDSTDVESVDGDENKKTN